MRYEPVIALILALSAGCTAPSGVTEPDRLDKPRADGAAPSDAWLTAVKANIAASAQPITRDAAGDLVGDLAGIGHRARFTQAQVQLTPLDGDEPSLSLSLTAWGRADTLREPVLASPALGDCADGSAQRADCTQRVEQAGTDGLVAWWVRRNQGVEQGWTLHAPPTGAGPVLFDTRVDGAAVVAANGVTATIIDALGFRWQVNELRAWDANGAALTVGLTHHDGHLRVAVDVDDAAWPVTVDPVYTSADFIVESEYSDDFFAFSLKSVGDVNADGYDDFAVGAQYTDANRGRVYLYLGGPGGPSTTPHQIYAGSNQGENFGAQICDAIDLNDDGYDDLIIANQDWSNRQRVFVYYGSPSGTDASPATTFDIPFFESAPFGFGLALVNARNYFGGSDALAISHTEANDGYGAIYVYQGGIARNTNDPQPNDIISFTDQRYCGFGRALAAIGDVDSNGLGDLAVGAPYCQFGYVGIYAGASGGGLLTSLTGATPWGEFGYSLAAGDLNGDGRKDLIVGEPQFQGSSGYYGAVTFHQWNSGTIVNAPTQTYFPTPVAGDNGTGSGFGWSVSANADFELDGYDDLVVGFPFAVRNGNGDAGNVSIFAGRPGGPLPTPTVSIEGSGNQHYLGITVDGGGDFVGDQARDLLIGQLNYFTGERGQVRIHRAYTDEDGDGFDSTVDCNDNDSTVYPGAPERCDGRKNNCNTPGGIPANELDADGDGYVTCTNVITPYGLPGIVGGGDCQDTGPNAEFRNPGLVEICDGLDNDCAGTPAVPLAETDQDGDGYVPCTLTPVGWRGSPVKLGGDCQDTGPNGPFRNPGFAEVCDGIDNNCDGVVPVDETDQDGDGFVVCELTAAGWRGGNPVKQGGDCDDVTPNRTFRFPGNFEVCDGIDNDCAGSPAVPLEETDRDGDGYVVCAVTTWRGPLPAKQGEDCDDTSPVAAFRFPTNTEVCDGIDNDCAGSPSIPVNETDQDGDGYVPCIVTIWRGGNPVKQGGDCNDLANTTYPGAPEVIADDIDQNCDGRDRCFLDADNDGFGNPDVTQAVNSASTICVNATPGESRNGDDCDDNDPTRYPGAPEIPNDGIDQDCNGADLVSCYQDLDQDTYGSAVEVQSPTGVCLTSASQSGRSGDCDDSNSAVNPSAVSVCDGVDNNCDGRGGGDYDYDNDGLTWNEEVALGLDDCDPDVDGDGALDGIEVRLDAIYYELANLRPDAALTPDTDGDGKIDGVEITAACIVLVTETQSGSGVNLVISQSFPDMDDPFYADCAPDADGDLTPDWLDCDDSYALAYPGAPEICDGVDNSCNGLIDDEDPLVDLTAGPTPALPYFPDFDNDGQGDQFGEPIFACAAPEGYADNNTDCDDNDPDTYQGAPEQCNNTDNNCDGIPDNDVVDQAYWPDADGDGFGDANAPAVFACSRPLQHVTNNLDCHDGDPTINPNALDMPYDNIDSNCDGLDDFDFDQDGYVPTQYAASSPLPDGDCDDEDPDVNPGAVEIPYNGIDDNCDGADLTDVDNDGYDSVIVGGDDCDDNDPLVNPAAEQVCDGVDNNCDAMFLEGELTDADGDGVLACDDCDDHDPTVAAECDETPPWIDSDGDGVPDHIDPEPNNNGSGRPAGDGPPGGPDSYGCGCATNGPPGSAFGALLVALLGLRRRRG